jgi:predicted nucleic acid-binding protein
LTSIELVKAKKRQRDRDWPMIRRLIEADIARLPSRTPVAEHRSLGLLPLDASDGLRIRELMRKYRDLPMDIAGASLVRLAEREGLRRVFTTDRRDFSVYRVGRTGRFAIVP